MPFSLPQQVLLKKQIGTSFRFRRRFSHSHQKRDRYPLIIKNNLLHLTTLECLDTCLLLGNTYSPWKTSFVVKNVVLTYDVDHVKVGTKTSRYYKYQYNILIEIPLLSKSINLRFEKILKESWCLFDTSKIFL